MVDELAVVSVLLAAVALISCLSVEDKRVIRRMPRALWITVILLVPLAGPVSWFLAGRPPATGAPRTGWRTALRRPEPPRPQAPEDDADFLQSLDQPPSSQEDRRPRHPEEDLHRREDE